MKFTVSEEFKRALKVAAGATQSRTAFPIYKHVLIVLGRDHDGYVAGANGTYSIRSHFGADVEKPGACTVPARQFVALVDQLEAGCTIERVRGKLVVTSPSTKAMFDTLDADEFVVLETITAPSTVDGAAFKDALRRVLPAAHSDAGNTLHCVRVAPDGHVIYLAAADGARASRTVIEAPDGKPGNYMIPVDAVRAMDDLDSGELYYAVAEETGNFLITDARTTISTSLLAGRYPDLERMFITASKSNTEVTVPVAEMKQAVARALIFAKDNANIIIVDADGYISGDLGSIGARIGVGFNAEGDSLRFAMNGSFIQDAINVMGSDVVRFETLNDKSPVVFSEVDGDPEFKALIMPMQIMSDGLEFPD